jgi:hypothetical protein
MIYHHFFMPPVNEYNSRRHSFPDWPANPTRPMRGCNLFAIAKAIYNHQTTRWKNPPDFPSFLCIPGLFHLNKPPQCVIK